MFSPVVAKTLGVTALNFVLSLGARIFKNQKADSLVRFTKSTRVEPIVLVDQRMSHLPYTPDIMQALSSIFIGYYLQAVSLAVNVGRINVIRLLDTLNPTRDVQDAASAKIVDTISGNASLLSLESYKYGLPVPGEAIGMENFGDAAWRAAKAKEAENLAGVHGTQAPSVTGGAAGKDSIKAAYEAVNLSVGKLIEVTVEDGDKKATFPIAVRLISTIIGSNILTHILGDGSRNVTAKERFHAWRSGQLEFWRDIVMASDLIDEHRSAMMKEQTGVYSEILARRRGNAASAALTGSPSIATASNLVVLSAQTAKELEASIGGRLADPKVRKKIFENTYIMLMVVVDTEWEQVKIYTRGIAIPTELSVKDLKTANKGTGPDVAEILKAYQLGNSPSI